MSNTIVFYNPITRCYYRPKVFKLDEGRLPVTNFPKHVKYEGGLTCGLFRNRTDPTPEPFPPGTRVSIDRGGETPLRGSVVNVPLVLSSDVSSAANLSRRFAGDGALNYVVALDTGGTIEVSFEDLIKPGRSDQPPQANTPDPSVFDGMPHFLRVGSKITMDHDGAFHKGYLNYTADGGFRFEVRRNARSLKTVLEVPLPDFKQHWTTLIGENIIIPGHTTVSSFLRPTTSNNAPSARHVSAKNLLSPCPPSLLKAIHPSNPDRKIWLDSYAKEKGGWRSARCLNAFLGSNTLH